jgi:hypothetical protein
MRNEERRIEGMEPRQGTIRGSEQTRLKSASIETTLYDLIGAVQEVLPREEENMVTLVVCNLLSRGTAKFHNFPRGSRRILIWESGMSGRPGEGEKSGAWKKKEEAYA